VRPTWPASDQLSWRSSTVAAICPMRERPPPAEPPWIDAWAGKTDRWQRQNQDGHGFPSAQSLTNPRS